MIEHVEEFNSDLKLMAFKGHLERFVDATIQAVYPISSKRVATCDIRAIHRINQKANASRINRIAVDVRETVAGNPKNRVSKSH